MIFWASGIAFADEGEGEGEWNQIFISAIKAGFDRDVADKPGAKWLGSGTLEVLHSEKIPEVEMVRPEGNIKVIKKTTLAKIREARGNISSRRLVSWAAWVNASGVVNLAISAPIQEEEEIAIKALAGVDGDVFPTKRFVGPTLTSDGWMWRSAQYLSHITLGTNSTDLEDSLNTLREIRVIK